MSGQVTITQLPAAAALTGSESVPIVQNGVTVQTTTGAISGAGALNYPFLTVGTTSGLSQARYMTVGAGLTTVDNGAGTTFAINMTGAASALNSMSNGLVAKTATNTVVNRQITVGGGMTISNGDGIAGNPAIGLNTNLQNLSSLSGTGLMTINGSTFSQVTLQGTTNSISIANPDASTGSPTFSISPNPVLSGTGGLQVPSGTTAQRLANNGVIRYNSDTSRFEFYEGGTWVNVGVGDGTVTYVNGTANQIQVTNPTTTPTIALVSNPTLPGTAFVQLPLGTTAQRGTPSVGALRYNTDTNFLETYTSAGWGVLPSGSGIATFSAGTTGLTPNTPTAGAIVLGGTLNVANGGTGLTSTPANGQIDIGNGTGFTRTTLTAGSGINITNSAGGITIASTATGTVTSVTGTAPIASTGGTTPAISISQATTSTNGYLSSTDWNTFNNKQPAGTYVTTIAVSSSNGFAGTSSGTATPTLTLSTSVNGMVYGNGTALGAATISAPLSYSAGTLSITQATTNTNGYLSSTDWNTFNNKQPAGTYVTSVTGTAPVVSSGGTTPAISMAAANTTTNGYLTSTDWNTFNNKGSGTVTSVAALTLGTTGTDLSSTVANGTTTPVITLNVPTASATNRGALSSTDWSTFNGKQAALVSGTNIKTVGGVSLLGAGDVGVIGATYGGTGVNNGSNTLTLAGNVTHAGAFTQTFTATANTSLTLPTSGYLISSVTQLGANPVTGTPSSATFLRGDGTWAAPSGSGTVTSVSFTGGIISIANPTSTPALTVAGTSGGVVYFSSATTWASSALLTANALMIGGGAGAAPATTTTGTGVLTALGNATNAASGIVVKDANSNVAANSFIPGWASTATAAGTTTLTVSSAYYQRFTGTNTQTVVLPAANTVALGQGFVIDNDSTGNVTLQDGTPTTLLTILPGMAGYIFCENNGSVAGSWSGYQFVPGTGPSGAVTWGTAGIAMGGGTISGLGQLTSIVATGTAPFVVASTTQVANLNAATAGTATNATNVALSAGTGATNYIPFSATATGNQPLTTNTLLTYNYTNNTLTAGISGGAF